LALFVHLLSQIINIFQRFIDAVPCLKEVIADFVGAVAGFVGSVLSRPGNGHRRLDKHDVFINNSRCL